MVWLAVVGLDVGLSVVKLFVVGLAVVVGLVVAGLAVVVVGLFCRGDLHLLGLMWDFQLWDLLSWDLKLLG